MDTKGDGSGWGVGALLNHCDVHLMIKKICFTYGNKHNDISRLKVKG